MARSRRKGYRAAIKYQTTPLKQVNYKAEPSKVMLLHNALRRMTNWDTATPEMVANYQIVKEHNQYWVDKFAGKAPVRPASQIDWEFYGGNAQG